MSGRLRFHIGRRLPRSLPCCVTASGGPTGLATKSCEFVDDARQRNSFDLLMMAHDATRSPRITTRCFASADGDDMHDIFRNVAV